MTKFLPFAALCILVCSPVSSRAAEPDDRRAEVDQSVDKALDFLHNQQNPDGSWNVWRGGKSPAITSLAVMAFLSAGSVPGEGKHGETVQKGIDWVLKQQLPNGLIAGEAHHEMYHHGICTIMLAEVAGMTDGKLGEEVRQKLEKAVQIILKGQRTVGVDKGGWRYRVEGTDSDISVTGWQLMALRAAKNLGCDVPPEAIDRAIEYVKRCQDSGTGGFRYMVRAGVTVPCTGTSILGLELCGKDEHRSPEVLKAGAFLLRNLPRWGEPHFFYSIYYCTQATFQLGGNYWDAYRPRMQESLLKNQVDNGSWHGRFGEDQIYGPNYGTAMAVLALTVEYRFLPIYQRGEEPAEKK
jgi:squalene cyclase